jgi:hypothetical protein
MKKIIGLFLILFSVNCFAGWELYAGGDGVDVYIDLSTLRKIDKKERVWTLSNYSVRKNFKGLNKDYQSIKSYYEVDCSEEKSRILSMQFFSDAMGNGEVIYSNNEYGNWNFHAPGSLGSSLIRVVCRK